MRRKMIGQRRRVIVVEREKTQEENIFGQQRVVIESQRKLIVKIFRRKKISGWADTPTDISMIVDSEFAISQLI